MKRILLAMSFASLLAPCAPAQEMAGPPAPPPDERMFQPPRPPSPAAVGAMIWMPWLRPAAPDDGGITAEKLEAARQAFLAYFDKDGNGSIGAEELAAAQAEWVNQADTDGDGTISREELHPDRPHHPRGHRGFPGGSQQLTAEQKASLDKARADLREAQSSGDKTRIDAARKALWELRRTAFGHPREQ